MGYMGREGEEECVGAESEDFMEGERGQEETATASPPPEQAKDVRRWRERGCV